MAARVGGLPLLGDGARERELDLGEERLRERAVHPAVAIVGVEREADVVRAAPAGGGGE